MIAARLLQRVERNWEQIAAAVIVARDRDPLLPHYRNLADAEIRDRVLDLTTQLALWLTHRNEAQLAQHFEALGRRRYQAHVPLHEVIQKLTVIKRAILTYASEQNYCQDAVELYGELELLRAMAGYFDLVVYRVAKGYEEALQEAPEWDPGRFRLARPKLGFSAPIA